MSVAEFIEISGRAGHRPPVIISELELGPFELGELGRGNINEELNRKIKEALGQEAQAQQFVTEEGIRGLPALGDASYEALKLLRQARADGLRILGLAKVPHVVLPPLFRVRFLNYSLNIAYVSSKVQAMFGFKEASYPAVIAGGRFRLYFSEGLKQPFCVQNKGACQYFTLGELVLPVKACERIYGECQEPPKSGDEAVAASKETGRLHPNYAFAKPSQEARAAILKGEFKPEPSLILYFALNGVDVNFKGEMAELVEGDMLKVLRSYVSGELEGVKVPRPLRPSVKVRENFPLPREREGVMGVLPEGPVKINYCERCSRETPFSICESCGGPTKPLRECPKCGIETTSERCPRCGGETKPVISRRYSVVEGLMAAASLLGLNVNAQEVIYAGSAEAYEPAQKVVLRKFFSIYCDLDGVRKVPVRFEAADVGPDEIVLPYRTASSLAEVARLVDAELKLIYKEGERFSSYSPESLIGSKVVVMHRALNYGVELTVKGLRNEFEALVSPGTLASLFNGSLFNVGYVALSADVGLNYLGPRPFIVFRSAKQMVAPLKPYLSKSSYTRQGFVELEKGVLEGMLNMAPEALSINEIIEHANEIELAYSTQKHLCEKCGRTFRVPPLNYRCPACGSKLRPFYYTADLGTMIPLLENLAAKAGVEGELTQIYIGKLQSMIKSSTQMSLFEF